MSARFAIFLLAGLAAVPLGAAPAVAQAVFEEVDGLSRICSYPPVANVLSVGSLRTLRVGLGENCPITYPGQDQTTSLPPPTAQLQRESVVDDRRSCVYGQAGRSWTLEAPAGSACPIAAGMIARRAGGF